MQANTSPTPSHHESKLERVESLIAGEKPEEDISAALATLPPPPDGGLWAWLQVVAALFCNFNSWGVVNAFGVYQEYYQQTLLKDESPFRISWIVSLSGSLLLFGTNFFGGFVDLGYMKHIAFLGCFLQFAALMLLSWSKTYAEVILTQGLFSGIISSMLFLLSISTVAPYFSKKRPLAIGLGASGSSLGGTVYSSIARKLITSVGFGWSTRIIAFIQLATTFIMFLCIRRRLPPTQRKAFIAHECLKEPVFMLYVVGNMCGFLGLYVFYVYYESYAVSINPNVNAFLYMTAVINAGSFLGRILPAYVATYVGPLNVLIPCEIGGLVVLFCWMVAKSEGAIIAIAVIFGFISGPLIGLPGAIVSSLTKDFNRLGIRLSFAFTFFSFGIVLGPSIAGIIQRKYGWFWLQLYAGLSWVALIICHVLARIIHSRGKLMVKM